MRVVLQRVKKASVSVDGDIVGRIGEGMLALVGFENDDTTDDLQWMAGKISRLRIFDDSDGVMNLSITDCKGEFLVISQFTLHAKVKKGNRPSYIKAAPPEISIPLYEEFLMILKKESNLPIQKGVFGANMQVSLVNDGPVTITIDTKNKE
ncbi:MAG: D-aminoacyl-tRNA deacylase [Bacteroidales bacterium]|jgi:D-tyrosyl-tRNA(Tyr) deacylase|nr:D-aminoacyl-tRNA deacylase [Bacteroidales bacterium]MDD4673738.1 D-aminoacyl-tRNA deacylase [Bacteroidales bacterium]MDY0161250.1 D-aminoacyl-tRNA deacylase [Bacteroidales bacterium]MDY0349023.1 D-aminoacyl-tRNA deacylase [Tenuifilaceae bacterium]